MPRTKPRCKKCCGAEDVENTYCGMAHIGGCAWVTVTVPLCIDCRIVFKTLLLETAGQVHISDNATAFIEAVRK